MAEMEKKQNEGLRKNEIKTAGKEQDQNNNNKIPKPGKEGKKIQS